MVSLLAIAAIAQSAVADSRIERTTLFREGAGAYNNYRIPAVIRTTRNSILAFCEGRQTPRGPGNDTGEINVIVRRSTDGGATFGDAQIVWADGKNTCGNPCPVVDEATGTIWMLMTHNHGEDHEADIIAGKSNGTRTVWAARSDDDGVRWSKPREITSQVKQPDWAWFATGPGVGIQMKHGPHAGRLVIPCDYVARGGGSADSNSLVIYSDDHGATWTAGSPPARGRFNECQVVELAGGRLLLNMRNVPPHPGEDARFSRGVAISDDGGATFGDPRLDPALIEPRCQASILRYSWPGNAGDGIAGRILFSNPASQSTRTAMTVRMSDDDAQTWPVEKLVYKGLTGYSSLVTLADGSVGLLYEAGDQQKYERIDLARFDLNWLTDGKIASGPLHASTTVPNSQWTALPDLPDPTGVAGAFVGETGGAVLLAGGANFPKAPPWRGGEKVCVAAVHALIRTTDRAADHQAGYRWIANVGELPHPLSYGVSITTDRGVVMIGGCDASRCYADVNRVRWTPAAGLKIESLPPLPVPLAYMTGARAGDLIFIAGGQETVTAARATNHFFTLDLSKEGSPDFVWREQTPWGGAPRVLAQSAGIIEDGKASFYLFSGRNAQAGQPTELLTDAYRFDAASKTWESLPKIQPTGAREPICVMAGSALIGGARRILLLGGDSGKLFMSIERARDEIAKADGDQKQKLQSDLDRVLESHPGFPGSVIEYDTAARTYTKLGALPQPAPLTTTCIWWNSRVLIPSGEIRPGVRTPKVWLGPPEMKDGL